MAADVMRAGRFRCPCGRPFVVGIVVCMAVAAMPVSAQAALSLTPAGAGGWQVSVDQTDLDGGPGSDFAASYVSGEAQQALEVSGTTGPSDAWCVEVRRSGGNWDSDVTLEARVTDDGTGNGQISVPDAYQAVSATYGAFFCGTGDRSGITVQLRLTGISVSSVPAQTYSTYIVYSLVESE